MAIINNLSDFNLANKSQNSGDFSFDGDEFNFLPSANTINGNIEFTNCVFNVDVDFSNDTFNRITFKSSVLKKDFELHDSELNGVVYFVDTTIKGRCDFSKAKFTESVFFDECNFNAVNIIETLFSKRTDFTTCKFYEKVDFNNTNFKGKTRFYSSEFFEKAIFDNTSFHELADFWSVEFHKTTIFYKTDFNKTTVFSSAKFHENVLFTHSLLKGVIIFRGTVFKKGFDLSTSILIGFLSIFDIDIKYFESVPDLPRGQDSIYDSYVRHLGKIPDKNKIETFRILKNQTNSLGNVFFSLKFSALETQAYQESLKRIKGYWNKEDYIILLLNKWSNNHGLSWIRGVAFTLCIGFLFFYFSLLATECYSFGWPCEDESFDFVKNFGDYFKSLSPIHEFNYMDYNLPTGWFYLWDFIGRTFVGYGIYQTIQAFRKFRK